MKDSEKEFYSHIGLLSIQFAKMEYKLSVIIGGLFGTEEDLVSLIVTEKNSLSQNIDLLRNLNRIKGFKEEKINELIKKVNEVREERNLFIHGIWKTPTESNGSVEIVCEERKLKYTEDKKDMTRSWSYNRHYVFNLREIKDQIDKIEEIISIENTLLQEMENANMLI